MCAEPEKKGNSNRGEPLKRVTKNAKKVAPILGCEVILLEEMHILLGAIESTHNISKIADLCKKVHTLYLNDYGDYSTISPSMHRVLHHTVEYMTYWQEERDLPLGVRTMH